MRMVNAFVAGSLMLAGLSATAPAQAGGDAAVAGVAGLAVGALLGNAMARPRYLPGTVYVPGPPPVVYQPAPAYYVVAPEPWTGEWYSYCASRYRSFDGRSGTFTDYDGYRKFCR